MSYEIADAVVVDVNAPVWVVNEFTFTGAAAGSDLAGFLFGVPDAWVALVGRTANRAGDRGDRLLLSDDPLPEDLLHPRQAVRQLREEQALLVPRQRVGQSRVGQRQQIDLRRLG